MLYHCENPVLRIKEVAFMRWGSCAFHAKARDFSALALRLKGSGSCRSGGQTFFLDTEHLLYMPQGIGYDAEHSDTEILVFHFVTASADMMPESYPIRSHAELQLLFAQAQAVWEEKAPGYTAQAMSLLYKIFGVLSRQEAEDNLPPYFLQAMEFIHRQYTSGGLRIKDICRNSGIGETSFRKIFRQQYGQSPVEYITALRLEHARNLIAGGETVEAAAQKSGFNDSKYFARVVRRVYRCTPRQLKIYGK